MSLTVAPNTICFPDQQAIIKYITGHPLKASLDEPALNSTAPDSVERVSKCFAGKKMSPDAILENVKIALTNTDEEQKLVNLEKSFQSLIMAYDEIDAKSSTGSSRWSTISMRELHSEMTKPDYYFESILKIYETILHDLIDNAVDTPPQKGEETRQRHVDDLTGRN